MIYSIDVQITAPVHDTEVTDRVADAIRNLFPEAEVETHPGELLATCHSMDHLSERLHEQAILDSARGAFFANHEGDTFTFDLKKQAAFRGVVNFAVGSGSELGDIHVRVRVNEPDVESFVDHVAPPTEDGRPVDTS
ncbi:coaE operon protein [Natronomonas salina]|uniref:RNA-binding domain-containing protein n=1 Tax=Natronomonas salina TaxID=1710540 RepID=UPI0015B7305F|nr:RNA-binding domain-containing protein [Natronomonas salina]QLD89306.1 coaE operon protein [Natronomonas salina]